MYKGFIVLCLTFLLVCTGAAHARVSASYEGDSTPGKPVILGNTTVFTLKGFHGYSTEGRAGSVTRRIQWVADNPKIDPASITTISYPQPITLISANNELVMVVFEDDARMAGISRKELAAQWSQELRKAVEQYRDEQSPRWLLKGMIKTLVAILVFLVVLLVMIKLYRMTDRLLHEWITARRISIHIQSYELVKAESIGEFLSAIMKIIRLVLVLFLFYVFIYFVLSSFPWTLGYADQILHFAARPFAVMGQALLVQIPNLFFVAIIVLVAHYFMKLLHMFFTELENGVITLEGFYPEWAQPTYKICRILTIIVAFVMAFPYIPGSGSSAFKAITLFMGVLLSLGSTSTIANLLGGYSLIYRRVFKVGDRVKVADFMGDVMEMGLQVTHLRTIKNEDIVVPNSTIMNSSVINYSSLARQKGLILHAAVTIGYDTPWRQIHALLLMAADRTPGLLRDPAPFILQTALNDFYVAYELNVYCDTPTEMVNLYSELYKNVQDAFNEYGVQIMSPSYRFDPEKPKVVPRDRWYAAPAQAPEPGEQEPGKLTG